RGAIATVGIGMMAFHQRLESGLDLMRRGVRLQAERIERPALGIADRTYLCRSSIGTLRTKRSAHLPEHVERIIRAAALGMEARSRGGGRWPPAAHAHLPGRPVSDDRLLLIAGNVVGAHAGEEIVSVVVLTHVSETEMPVFALAQPALRRPMR